MLRKVLSPWDPFSFLELPLALFGCASRLPVGILAILASQEERGPCGGASDAPKRTDLRSSFFWGLKTKPKATWTLKLPKGHLKRATCSLLGFSVEVTSLYKKPLQLL